jgi:hypothetical protein
MTEINTETFENVEMTESFWNCAISYMTEFNTETFENVEMTESFWNCANSDMTTTEYLAYVRQEFKKQCKDASFKCEAYRYADSEPMQSNGSKEDDKFYKHMSSSSTFVVEYGAFKFAEIKLGTRKSEGNIECMIKYRISSSTFGYYTTTEEPQGILDDLKKRYKEYKLIA